MSPRTSALVMAGAPLLASLASACVSGSSSGVLDHSLLLSSKSRDMEDACKTSNFVFAASAQVFVPFDDLGVDALTPKHGDTHLSLREGSLGLY